MSAPRQHKWRLKDMRRHAAKDAASVFRVRISSNQHVARSPLGSTTDYVVAVPGYGFSGDIVSLSKAELLRVLDSLISLLGPDWAGQPEEAGEARPKDTCEVAPSSQVNEEAPFHGGDGASGEVNDSPPRPGPDAAQDDSVPMAGAPGSPAKAGESPRPANGGGEEAEASPRSEDQGEPTAGVAPPPAPEAGAADNPHRDGADGASAASGEGEPESADEGRDDGGPVTESPPEGQDRAAADDGGHLPETGAPLCGDDNTPSLHSGVPVCDTAPSACSSWGGDFRDHPDAVRVRALAASRAAREIRRALDRLLKAMEVGLGYDPSPRLDPRRLVREMVARRWALSRVRREEMERCVSIIAVDCSGSCSAYCNELLAGAMAVADADPQVVVVCHSNGTVYPPATDEGWYDALVSVYGRGLRKDDFFPRGDERYSLADFCRRVAAIRGGRIAGVVALGDWDAGEEYRQLCEAGVPLVWLDSYCARDGVKPASPRLREGYASWHRKPLAHWQGVSGPVATAVALRLAAREVRR